MNYEFFDCEIENGVAIIKLIGACERSMTESGDELIDLSMRLQEDRAVRALLFSDAECSFDFGVDTTALAEARSRNADLEPLAPELDVTRRVITLLREMAKPVVAAARGDVRDGGLGLFMTADVRLAADTASFTAPNILGGLLPDWGLSHALPLAMGPGGALEFIWSGRTMPAAEASASGLVDRLVPSDVYEDELERFVERLAAIPQPAAYLSKLVNQQARQFDITTMLSLEYEAQQQCWSGRETVEGLNALADGRPPIYPTLVEDSEE